MLVIFWKLYYSEVIWKNPHTHTSILRPFFRECPGEPVPEENFLLDFMVQGEITEADTLTIRMGATPSGLISNPPSSPVFYAGCPSCRNRPTLSWHGTGTKCAGLRTYYPVAWFWKNAKQYLLTKHYRYGWRWWEACTGGGFTQTQQTLPDLPLDKWHRFLMGWLSFPSPTSSIKTSKGNHLLDFVVLFYPWLPSVVWRCWLGGRKGTRPVRIEWSGTGMVICLERGANDLYMVQLMPLPPQNLLLQ